MGIFDITASANNVVYQEKIFLEIAKSNKFKRALNDNYSDIAGILGKDKVINEQKLTSSQTFQEMSKIAKLSSDNSKYVNPPKVPKVGEETQHMPIFGGHCYFVNTQLGEGKPTYLPVFPEEIGDQISATWSDTTIVGRSSPVSAYISTGFRSVSFSFDLHEDMMYYNGSGITQNTVSSNKSISKNGTKEFMNIISRLRATVYPEYSNGSGMKPPLTLFRFGRFVVKGIVRSVGFNWKKPLNDDNGYKICTVSISIDGISPKVMGATEIVNTGLNAMDPYGNVSES